MRDRKESEKEHVRQNIMTIKVKFLLLEIGRCDTVNMWETKARRLALFSEGIPSGRKKGGMPVVTYADLIQFCILMVALVGLCYQIFRDKRK